MWGGKGGAPGELYIHDYFPQTVTWSCLYITNMRGEINTQQKKILLQISTNVHLSFTCFSLQLLCCCVCCMWLLVWVSSTGKDLSESLRTPSPVQPVVRTCDCVFKMNVCIFTWMDAKLSLCSACNVDTLSCECCKMVRETKRLQTYFNTTLTNLERELDKANQTFVTLQGENHFLKIFR